jgi:hypothetical protein
VQRKQQVGECWVCVIFFAQVVVFERLHRAHRGVRGGEPRGVEPPKFFFALGRHIIEMTYFRDHMIFRWFFGTWFFAGFLFLVKELGFWTNPGHWVRVLDATGSFFTFTFKAFFANV